MNNIYFGKNLKYLRESSELKNADFLTAIDFKRSTWSGYENENSFPSLADFIRIAEYFGISETDLLHFNLSAGGDLSKKKIHKIYNYGGDLGGDVGGDSVVNEPDIGIITGDNIKAYHSITDVNVLRMLLAEKTSTIAALNNTIKTLESHNSTLNALVQEMGKDDHSNSKRFKAG